MPSSLDDLTCSICLAPLINQLDEFNDVKAVSALACGHVFHDDCIEEWFASQIRRFREDLGMTPQGDYPYGIHRVPPLTCTTCLKPVPMSAPAMEGGSLSAQKMQLYFGLDDPVCDKPETQEQRELRELARGTKTWSSKLRQLDERSTEEQTKDLIVLGDDLSDMVEASPAMERYQVHVDRLVESIEAFKIFIQLNPLLREARTRVNEVQAQRDALQKLVGKLRQKQEELKCKITETEKTAMSKGITKGIAQAQKKMEEIVAELKQTQVRSKLRAEQYAELQRRIQLQEKEVQDREDLLAERTRQLAERSEQLRLTRLKAESRRELKSELDQLKTENAQLRANLSRSHTAQTPSKSVNSSIRQSSREHADWTLPNSSPPASSSSVRQRDLAGIDDSLLVEQPSSDGLSASLLVPYDWASTSTGSNRRSVTARQYSVEMGNLDLNAGIGRTSMKRNRSDRHSSIRTTSSSSKPGGVAMDARATSRSDKKGVLIEESPEPEIRYTIRQQKANPFATTRMASEQKKQLKADIKIHTVEDISDVSDHKIRQRQRSATGISGVASFNPTDPTTAKDQLRPNPRSKGGSFGAHGPARGPFKKITSAEVLGIADPNGRPKQGIVSGAKRKVRA